MGGFPSFQIAVTQCFLSHIPRHVITFEHYLTNDLYIHNETITLPISHPVSYTADVRPDAFLGELDNEYR